MHIVLTTIRNIEYCYVAECIWNHEANKYDKTSKLVGKLNDESISHLRAVLYQLPCQNGKIEGASKFGNAWAIPENTPKPTRTGEYKPGRKPKCD